MSQCVSEFSLLHQASEASTTSEDLFGAFEGDGEQAEAGGNQEGVPDACVEGLG